MIFNSQSVLIGDDSKRASVRRLLKFAHSDTTQKKLVSTTFRTNGTINLNQNQGGGQKPKPKPSGGNGGGNQTSNGNDQNKGPKKEYCNYCRRTGHTKENCIKLAKAKAKKSQEGNSGNKRKCF